jgi:hypothetical protein
MSDAHTQVNVVCTILMMLATIAYAIIAGCQLAAMNGQLRVMRGTLAETRQSGRQSADQMSEAVGNINWMARTTDQSSKDTLAQMKAQSEAMQRSANSVVSANRPWVVPDFPPQHKRTIQEANLEWHNAGKTPAVSVFSTTEYFIAEFPHRLRTCAEMERKLRKQPLSTWQFQGFVAQDGRYETGLANTPTWVGQAPINIHGCVWYTDILSNTQRTTEFFYTAFQNRFAFPASEGVSIFYLSDRPFVYK